MSATLNYVRTYVVRFLLVIGCVATLASWYLISPQADAIAKELSLWNVNIASFSLFVGIITIFARYYRTVRDRAQYWQYQLYSMVLIIVWVIFGYSSGIYSDVYQVAYLSTKITCHIAMLGIMVFFITSGAYRLFRIRNLRTALFTISMASIAALNAPWLIGAFPQADLISKWLLDFPAAAGGRGLAIAGGLGSVVLAVRILLGTEKGALRVTEVEVGE